MPDYPYVYAPPGTPPPRPVEPGGTRIRVFRRRRGPAEEETGAGGEDAEERLRRWREALQEAVEELNAELAAAGLPHRVRLGEDREGFWLHVTGFPPGAPPLRVDELLDPADLPRWLARLRTRLGLLVDETA